MKSILLSFILLCFLGCSSPQRTTLFVEHPPSPHKAIVYLYRLDTFYQSGSSDFPVFYFNGAKVGPLSVGGYYVAELNAGPLEVSYSESILGIPMKTESAKVKLDLEVGKIYFVKYELEWGAVYFNSVPASYGLKDIQKTKLLKP